MRVEPFTRAGAAHPPQTSCARARVPLRKWQLPKWPRLPRAMLRIALRSEAAS